MNLKCKFKYIRYGKEDIYTCLVYEADIKAGATIKKFAGKKHGGRSNIDVQAIWFDSSNIEAVPKGIIASFPNIRALSLISCNLKSIDRADLSEFKSLTHIYVHYNKTLTSLPDDLFEGMTFLREISFLGNNISNLTSKIFEPIRGNKLEYVDFCDNPAINAFYCPGMDNTLASMEDLVKIVEQGNIESDKVCPKFKENVLSSLKKIWETMQLADCSITHQYKTLAAHKLVLSMHSTVIAEFFRNKDDLNILGYDPLAIQHLLRYCYTGLLPDLSTALDVFRMSIKCKIDALRDGCEDLLVENVNSNNAIQIYNVATRYKSEKLTQAAFAGIRDKFSDIEIPDGFMNKPLVISGLIDAYFSRKRKIDEADNDFKIIKRMLPQVL